jgi:hypothetical protein
MLAGSTAFAVQMTKAAKTIELTAILMENVTLPTMAAKKAGQVTLALIKPDVACHPHRVQTIFNTLQKNQFRILRQEVCLAIIIQLLKAADRWTETANGQPTSGTLLR